MNLKKIGWYLLFSFGISWCIALLMLLLDIEYGTLLSVILLGALYMPGPAIATFIVQKFIYKEPFKPYGWTMSKKIFKRSLAVPLVFLLLIVLIFAVNALLGNTGIAGVFGKVDFSQEGFNIRFKELLRAKLTNVQLPEFPSLLFLLLALLQGILAGVTLNLPFMFGEEFGWRGLLQRETQKLGFLRSNLLIGAVWGLWHLPIILMGHNYPHHPYIGVFMMCLMTTGLAPVFGYVRMKTGSILGPCMLHGMINATASVFFLYIQNPHELLSSITGVAGVIASVIITLLIYLFDKKFVASYKELP
jgi:membrane protease YdiL (CAAX protease family)